MNYVNAVDTLDRYAPEKFLSAISGGDYITLDSVFLIEMRNLPMQSYEISTEQRPEAVAYKVYGDTQFTWIIMLYNKCFDITDGTFSAGTAIRYPSLDDLERISFSLKARQRAYDLGA